MAHPSLEEDPNTDFSGLASSLLPPSGAFLSGWTPQKWQHLTSSHNAHDMQNVQPPFSNSYNGHPFQTDPQGPSYEHFDPRENGTPDHAPSSGELSEHASVAPSKSAQAEFYQDMNSRGYGANQAASYAANQIHSTSAVFPDSSSMTSRNALNGVATPPGNLAELKLKAKESILAKKAQNVRSSPQDTSLQQNATESTIAINGQSLARNETSKSKTDITERTSSAARGELGHTGRSSSNLEMTKRTQKPPTEASNLSHDHPMANRNLTPIRDNNPTGVKASSTELEDLLAEGRAAAERRSRVLPGSINFQTSPKQLAQTSIATTRMQHDQTGTEGTASRLMDQRPLFNEVPNSSEKEQNDMAAAIERLPEHQPSSQLRPEYKAEEISGVISPVQGRANANTVTADGDTDMSDAPNPGDLRHPPSHRIQSHAQPEFQVQGSAHELSAAQGQYTMDDVEEWLGMTGFYDAEYRHKVLYRRRRMKAIEEERLQLLLEEQADQDSRSHLARSHSVLAANTAPVSPFLARPLTTLLVPTPSAASSATKDLGLRIRDSALKHERPIVAAKPAEPLTGTGSLKRRNSPLNANEEEGHARKIVRKDSNKDDAVLSHRASEKRSAGSPLARQESPRAPTERFVEEQGTSDLKQAGDLTANHSTKRRYDQWVPEKPAIYDDNRRNSNDARSGRGFDSGHRTSRSTFSSGHRQSDYQSLEPRSRYGEQDRFRRDSLDDTSPTKAGINLNVNNVRYFLIKSWNYENIEIAQRECTWCTQTKNEDLFVDAFRNSTHVILIFSANNSHAFQGYARMQSLPGEPGVPDPSWRRNLHWPTTKPFKIRWITKGDSSYRVARNLRNPLNDDSLVFVGRDGQEIPDRVGLELCEALDEDARYRGNRMDY